MWRYPFQPMKQKKAAAKKKVVTVFLTTELKTAVDGCQWLSGTHPFAYRATSPETVRLMANELYSRMQTIGQKIGVEDCRPHRLRDTFAVRALLRGVPVTEVSRLLYHESVVVTEKHYAPWVHARELRMEELLWQSMQPAAGLEAAQPRAEASGA